MRPNGGGGARPYGDPRNSGSRGPGGRPRPNRDWDRERPRSSKRPARKKPKAPVWTKLTIILGALVMFLSGAVVVVPKLLAAWALGDIPTTEAIPEELKGDNIDGPIDFLLIGTDAGEADNDPSHSGKLADSIVLLHIPASHNIAYLVSFPRDMRVPIARSASECGGQGNVSRINEAYAAGVGNGDLADTAVRGQGVARVAKTISCILEAGGGQPLTFEGAAIVNFDGFDKIVQALGSVHMCFDDDVWSIHYNAAGEKYYFAETDTPSGELATRHLRYHYPKDACRDLEPWQALDYTRQRKGLAMGDGDYGRQRHQQQLLRAIVAKVASTDTLTNFNTIGRLRDAAGELLTLDLNDIPLEDWVITLSSLRADSLNMIKTNAGKYAGTSDAEGNYIGERLTPEFKQLLQHVQNGAVYDFLVAHPDWIASDAQHTTG